MKSNNSMALGITNKYITPNQSYMQVCANNYTEMSSISSTIVGENCKSNNLKNEILILKDAMLKLQTDTKINHDKQQHINEKQEDNNQKENNLVNE
jgi:hypothetical protein